MLKWLEIREIEGFVGFDQFDHRFEFLLIFVGPQHREDAVNFQNSSKLIEDCTAFRICSMFLRRNLRLLNCLSVFLAWRSMEAMLDRSWNDPSLMDSN